MIKNKVAIITGGSRGIGRAIARKYAENGASLLLVALHRERLLCAKEEIYEISKYVDILPGDIAEPSFSQSIVARTIELFGTIDVLVNCAGIITRTPVDHLGLDEWHRVINVNLHGAFYLSQAVLPIFCAKMAGKIINITSQMAKLPHPNASPSYEVSKAGLVSLTRHLAFHYARYNICVNAIAPGSIDTDLPKSMTIEARKRLRKAIPLGRLGEPEEVGELAVFLASNRSDYITGATINISGGSLMD
ncbi:MAG: SDR family NAD(P)-dependent oxidoreductase [Syntrophales bacterium]